MKKHLHIGWAYRRNEVTPKKRVATSKGRNKKMHVPGSLPGSVTQKHNGSRSFKCKWMHQ